MQTVQAHIQKAHLLVHALHVISQHTIAKIAQCKLTIAHPVIKLHHLVYSFTTSA